MQDLGESVISSQLYGDGLAGWPVLWLRVQPGSRRLEGKTLESLIEICNFPSLHHYFHTNYFLSWSVICYFNKFCDDLAWPQVKFLVTWKASRRKEPAKIKEIFNWKMQEGEGRSGWWRLTPLLRREQQVRGTWRLCWEMLVWCLQLSTWLFW